MAPNNEEVLSKLLIFIVLLVAVVDAGASGKPIIQKLPSFLSVSPLKCLSETFITQLNKIKSDMIKGYEFPLPSNTESDCQIVCTEKTRNLVILLNKLITDLLIQKLPEKQWMNITVKYLPEINPKLISKSTCACNVKIGQLYGSKLAKITIYKLSEKALKWNIGISEIDRFIKEIQKDPKLVNCVEDVKVPRFPALTFLHHALQRRSNRNLDGWTEEELDLESQRVRIGVMFDRNLSRMHRVFEFQAVFGFALILIMNLSPSFKKDAFQILLLNICMTWIELFGCYLFAVIQARRRRNN